MGEVTREEFNGGMTRVSDLDKSVTGCQAEHRARMDQVQKDQERTVSTIDHLEDKIDSRFSEIFNELRSLVKSQTSMNVKLVAITGGIVFILQWAMQYIKVGP